MQDVSSWPESFDVSQPVARVLVDGQEVNVESVTVSSELDSAMPERVAAGGGGVVAATGTASILRPNDVSEAGFNPWGDAERFVNASDIVVEAGYHDPVSERTEYVRQVTSQVESLDGGAVSNTVGLDFVDHSPRLDRTITIEPLLEKAPPLRDEGARRFPGLHPLYVTDRVLRHCGFYATPPQVPGAVMSAPLMGSVVPECGVLSDASAYTVRNVPAEFRATSWGLGMGDGRAVYDPVYGARGHGRLTSTVHISFQLDTFNSGPGDTLIEVQWGSRKNAIQVQAIEGYLLVQYVQNGASRVVTEMGPGNVSASDSFTVLVEPSGQTTLYASNGAVVSGSLSLSQHFAAQSLSGVLVQGWGTGRAVGGVQVAFTDASTHDFRRTARLSPPPNLHTLQAFPSKIKANCLSLLKEQAEAELAAMWVDEFGVFQWRNRHQLRNTPPVGTLTAKDNLFDLSWKNPIRSVVSHVEVNHDTPTVTIRPFSTITVSDSRGSTLSNEDTEYRFYEPSADQDWHQVEPPAWLGGTVDYEALRVGRGSYRGGVVVDDDGNERLSYSSRLVSVWEQLGPQKWLLSSEAQNLSPDEHIEQRFRDRPEIYGRYADEDLPIIRAKGLAEWNEETIVGATRGPDLSPAFVHEAGPWIQSRTELRSLADWLAEVLTKPDVILNRVPIVPDPRIQLGDVFWLEDHSAYHIRLRVVIMGKTLKYHATGSGYEMSQEITCRILEVQRMGVRYDELEAAWEGRNYAALEDAWAGQDYDALEADPLDRS